MEKKNKLGSEVKFYLITIFTCIMAVLLIVVIALFIYDSIQNRRVEQTIDEMEVITYTQEELDALLEEERAIVGDSTREELLQFLKGNLTDTNSAIASIRPLYPNELVLVSDGKYHFVPINADLVLNDYVQESVSVLESGEIQYVQDDVVVSKKGIDISKYQGEVDWEKVKADGVEYAFLRLGFRGYGSGDIILDETYLDNIAGANAAGVKVGVYFFTQAITVEEAIEEADFVLEQIAPFTIDYPVVIDVEKVSDSSGRMNLITVEERTEIVKAFCKQIEDNGYKSMIYGNLEMFGALLNFEELEAYDKWYAYYGEQLYFPYEYQIWQYTDKGSVDGIVGEVDLNISFME